MKKIFRVEPDNVHHQVVWADEIDLAKLADLNFRSVKRNWQAIRFSFFNSGEPEGSEPDIACLTPSFAFKRDVAIKIFPEQNEKVELLPIIVEGEEWLWVNCLNVIRTYNETRSVLHRDFSGEIFMVQKLFVDSLSSEVGELFTIDKSNRSNIFVTESFVNRVKNLGLKGVQFKKIGEAND